MATPPTSPFLLIFRHRTDGGMSRLPAEDRQQLIQDWTAWFEGLTAQKKLELGRPLADRGRHISAGEERITDGPFAEGKEVVGGFFLLNVADLEEATVIGRQCPGLRYGISVEVRPLTWYCPVINPGHLPVDACAAPQG